MNRSPVLFLPHGAGPLPLVGDPGHAPLNRFLQDLPARLGRPAAILVVSAHWEAAVATVTGHPRPELIYDYYGFPPESYTVRYPAPGDPALAATIAATLTSAGIEAKVDAQRGFDHGLFVPLTLMYPQAEIACLQLSLLDNMDPATHIALGRALAPLRARGVLIIGSGLSFHNMRGYDYSPSILDERSRAFDRWLQRTLTENDTADATASLVDWTAAPHARFCHPREEHLLPLHVCFGAAAADAAEIVFDDLFMGVKVSGFLWGQNVRQPHATT